MGTDRLASAQVDWRAAEERLYPLAMVDPDSYRLALELVGRLLVQLRAQATTAEGLLELWQRPETLLAALPADRPTVIPEATLLGAALTVRAREVAVVEADARRAALIAAARADGREWVHLDGPADLAATVEGNRVELHLPSGTSLVAGVDPWSGDDPFLLRAVPADPAGRSRLARFRDRASWFAEYGRWRDGVTTLTSGVGEVSDSR